jgi:hypothetical protein
MKEESIDKRMEEREYNKNPEVWEKQNGIM